MEHLSTKSFVGWLDQEDFAHGTFLKVLKVDFNPEEFCSTIELSKKFKLIKSTDGFVSVVTEQADPADKSRQTKNFDFHTDGLYYKKPPDLVILYCVEPGRGDIVTTLADTTKGLKMLHDYRSVLDKLDLTYIGRGMKRYTRTLIENHPRTGDLVLNLAGRGFVSPNSKVSLGEIPDLREVTQSLQELYNTTEKSVILSHAWQKNDLMIFDNHTYLHGRFGPGADSQRKLLRIWIDLVNDDGSRTAPIELHR
jgi:alpha-ketoglutarate-dependent taurine dioxygenase